VLQNGLKTAIASYFSTVPIGGFYDKTSGMNVVPGTAIAAACYSAFIGQIVDVSPIANIPLSSNEVPVLDAAGTTFDIVTSTT